MCKAIDRRLVERREHGVGDGRLGAFFGEPHGGGEIPAPAKHNLLRLLASRAERIERHQL